MVRIELRMPSVHETSELQLLDANGKPIRLPDGQVVGTVRLVPKVAIGANRFYAGTLVGSLVAEDGQETKQTGYTLTVTQSADACELRLSPQPQ